MIESEVPLKEEAAVVEVSFGQSSRLYIGVRYIAVFEGVLLLAASKKDAALKGYGISHKEYSSYRRTILDVKPVEPCAAVNVLTGKTHEGPSYPDYSKTLREIFASLVEPEESI